jgi:hypothetical protein
MATMFVIQDTRTGLFFSRRDIREHGTWSTTTAFSPTFATADAAVAFGLHAGMGEGTFKAVELRDGIGGYRAL